MINEPSVDEMIRKLGTEEEPISRYALCTIAAKRARQIIETERNLGPRDTESRDKELLSACESWAKSKGCTEFASDCELANTQSLQFHLNVGFEEANRIICFTKKL